MADGAVDIGATMREMGRMARDAARILAFAPRAAKDAALRAAADAIERDAAAILAINAEEAEAGAANGLSSAFVDRMRLDEKRLAGVRQALRDIADQDDPIGESIASWTRPNGLAIERVLGPIGVIGVIYESRPNVTVDAAAICVKAGSAVILRGGSDCIGTGLALHAGFVHGLKKAGLPAAAAQIVATPDRAAVGAILSGLDGAIDLIIPRGGKSLVARVQTEARAPVLSHLDGVCHVYVDRSADLDKAVAIAVNAKMRRPGICGAMETLLIDEAILTDALPRLAGALREAGCALRADAACRQVDPSLDPASADDWGAEYLDAILSIAAVVGVDGAIAHIAAHGSGHTDAIVAEDASTAGHFLARVDSAIVMHNASTQFADGGEFGLGAEIGIATGKLHARGPVGVRELTTYKNVVRGSGQIRP